MKFVCAGIFLFLNIFSAFSQQNHFVYLQAENKQPFYVKVDNKTLNSSPAGYLILSKINDGIHGLVIGFSKNEDVEQEFNLSVNKKDVGYIIKNTAQRNWQLVNLQTLAPLNPGNVIVRESNFIQPQQVIIDTDAFSIVLAKVVMDSTILQRDIAEIKPSKPVSDSAALQNTIATNILSDSAKNIVPKKMIAVAKPGVKQKAKIKTVKPASDSTALQNTIAKKTGPDSLKNLSPKKIVAVSKPGVKQKVKIKTAKPLSDSTALQSAVAKGTPSDSAQLVASKKVVAVSKPGVKQKTKIKNAKPVSDSALLQKAVAKAKVSDSSQNIKTVKPLSDSAVLQKDVVKAGQDIQTETALIKKDSPAVIAPVANDQATYQPAEIFSHITRILKKKNKGGTELAYVDESGGIKDTISISIPTEKLQNKKDEPEVVISEPAKQDSSILKEKVNDQKKVADVPVVKSTMINSDCKNFATDDDFLKLRKKMVAEKNDENMIKVAKKNFKLKCFTTEQVKNLSAILLKDAGKYMFFDTAYPFVSDSENFPSLETYLTDSYYITRFRAMIHK